MNVKNILKKICYLMMLLTGGMMIISCDIQKQKTVLDRTPITVHIPSKISNDVLSITLPKCAFQLDQENVPNNNLTSNKAILTYNFLSYSGNLKNNFECTLDRSSGLYQSNYLQPIYPLADGQPIYGGYDYLTKTLKALGKTVIDERPFVQKRFVNAYQEMLLINGMPNQTTPFTLTYFKYDGRVNATPTYHYGLETIIQDKYYFQYNVFILVPENRHGHNLPDYNTDFAEKFRDIIQSNKNVLDYPEVIQGFVDNNERVVRFINEHSVITK